MKRVNPGTAESRARAFTLIEMLVVITIIGLLAAIIFPVFSKARESARRAACQSNLRQIGLAFTQYAQDYDERLPTIRNTGTNQFWDKRIEPYLGIEVVSSGGSPLVLRCPSDSGIRRNSSSICGQLGPNSIRSYAIPGNATTGCHMTCILGAYNSVTDTYAARNIAQFPVPAETFLLAERPTNNNQYATVNGGNLIGPSAQTAGIGCGDTARKLHFDGWNYLFVDGHVKWMKPETTYHRPGKTYPSFVIREGAANYFCDGTPSNPCGYWSLAAND